MSVHLTNHILSSGNLELRQGVADQFCWVSVKETTWITTSYSELRETKRKGAGRDHVAKERLRSRLLPQPDSLAPAQLPARPLAVY